MLQVMLMIFYDLACFLPPLPSILFFIEKRQRVYFNDTSSSYFALFCELITIINYIN